MKSIVTMAVIVLSIITFMGVASAQEDYLWSGKFRIRYVFPQEGEYAFNLVTTADLTPNATCKARFVIYDDHPNYNSYVATILTAYANDSLVNIYFDNTGTDCAAEVVKFAAY